MKAFPSFSFLTFFKIPKNDLRQKIIPPKQVNIPIKTFTFNEVIPNKEISFKYKSGP